MNVRQLIEELNNGIYNPIMLVSDKKTLASKNNVEINGILFPEECVSNWPEPRIADKNQLSIIIKMIICGVEYVIKSIKNCIILADISWPHLHNIIKFYVCSYEIKTLEELAVKINIYLKFNIPLNFDISNILTYTNNEIYGELIKIIDEKDTLEFISSIRRPNPTLENSFMNEFKHLINTNEFENEINEQTHYIPNCSRQLYENIEDIINSAPRIFNNINNNLLNDLGDALDGQNAILTGGSAFDSIIETNQPAGRDIDIFCTPAGFKQCYDRIKIVYNNIVLYTQYQSCINLIIPFQSGKCMLVQFIKWQNR
jgi:hypothetical protein